ncbi:MAG: NrdJb [endosymbiont of Galathealinum brachiosum]|uniref:ribonucleoside-diphosphate reductase n=1 Tax=endosymbiont of Galathealinum brachiosum TaxID=2200906 RepID=A0A370D747_9GAMM|nr:MAG: NrdJb [endosymbiont of Galathealinum brachiosum]
MATKIDKKIVAFKVVKEDEEVAEVAPVAPTAPERETMHENVERPEMLLGSTYKVKTPLSEHALYITINDVILNQGTDHEARQPYEIFINSKSMDQFQWVVALTRVISAVFRKGGDVCFLVEELKAVFDPQGGYFKKGGKFMPSLVAEIGESIESHMKMIGMIKDDAISEHQQQIMDEKRAAYEQKHSTAEQSCDDDTSNSFPAGAQLCKKCSTKATILMDGCMTCLNCGDSKCG